jgi:hypothetical protein
MNNRELGDLARSTSLPPSATLRMDALPVIRERRMEQ